jgi:hypothetical protein
LHNDIVAKTQGDRISVANSDYTSLLTGPFEPPTRDGSTFYPREPGARQSKVKANRFHVFSPKVNDSQHKYQSVSKNSFLLRGDYQISVVLVRRHRDRVRHDHH